MKKILSLLVLCFPLIAFAQLEKGKSFLTGSISYIAAGSKRDTQPTTANNSTGTASLGYGYLIKDNWAVGLTTSYYKYHYKNTYDSDYSGYDDSSLRIGPFVRRYFTLGEKFFFYLDGGVRADFDKTRSFNSNSPTTEEKTKGPSLYIQPGVTYFVSNKLALQAGLGGIEYRVSKSNDGYKRWDFNSSFGISSLYFGASWYF